MSTYTEADCLRIIARGTRDAYDLLSDEASGIERKFRSVDRALAKLLAEVRRTFPDAVYYTASGGFHLMLGSSHDERGRVGRPQLIALSGNARIGDGDF